MRYQKWEIPVIRKLAGLARPTEGVKDLAPGALVTALGIVTEIGDTPHEMPLPTTLARFLDCLNIAWVVGKAHISLSIYHDQRVYYGIVFEAENGLQGSEAQEYTRETLPVNAIRENILTYAGVI